MKTALNLDQSDWIRPLKCSLRNEARWCCPYSAGTIWVDALPRASLRIALGHNSTVPSGHAVNQMRFLRSELNRSSLLSLRRGKFLDLKSKQKITKRSQWAKISASKRQKHLIRQDLRRNCQTNPMHFLPRHGISPLGGLMCEDDVAKYHCMFDSANAPPAEAGTAYKISKRTHRVRENHAGCRSGHSAPGLGSQELPNEPMRSARRFKVSGSRFEVSKNYETNPLPLHADRMSVDFYIPTRTQTGPRATRLSSFCETKPFRESLNE